MKIGMNLLLRATHVTEQHYPHLEKIKATGLDGVEIPLFEGDRRALS
jgi:D-psicose/D-tagatose/L-ribulose 3-epimerase